MISEPRVDPHCPDVRWRYHEEWGLQYAGDPLVQGSQEFWTWGGADVFVPTRERISLWYDLMREVHPSDT